MCHISVLLMATVVWLGPGAQGINLNVAVLLPFNDSYLFSYHRVAPALELTIKKLNEDTRLLRRHQLMVRYSNSQCHIAVAMDKAFKFYMKREVDIFFGPVCDYAVAPVARQIRFWNIPMISPGAVAIDYINFRKDHFPLLTRLGSVHLGDLCYYISSQSRHFGWQKMKLLYTRDGQDDMLNSLCHLVVEALHYRLADIRPDLSQDYFKMKEGQSEEDVNRILMDEVGLDYGGWVAQEEEQACSHCPVCCPCPHWSCVHSYRLVWSAGDFLALPGLT
ncbi:hypothetical protein ACOMHN_010513 [Nucella lapillus]